MKLIGKYEVRGLLGRGGMGAVYKVRLPVIGKILALKLLDPQPALTALLGPEEIRRRFRAEAATMGSLRHPHIASIFDFEDSGEQSFFTMEYYCQNLGALINETYDLEAPTRILRVDRAIRYARQTLNGLNRLHQAGLVHRDIKPFNLLLTDEDTVKITDFGLSGLRGETFGAHRRLRVGSPFYTAPEQEKNPMDAGVPADLFSVGVMLYRLTTGFLPIKQIHPVSRLQQDLDGDWDDFFRLAFAPDPDRRFQSAREMESALGELESNWLDKNEKLCRLQPGTGNPPPSSPVVPLRSEGRKISPASARKFLNLDDLWRPRQILDHPFERLENRTVMDRQAKLIWQADGSDFALTWAEAHEYIQELNHRRHGSLDNWRLPTMDELLSIIKPPLYAGDDCLARVFGPWRENLWSADPRSALAAWYVNTDLGFAAWRDFTCPAYVRAVSSL